MAVSNVSIAHIVRSIYEHIHDAMINRQMYVFISYVKISPWRRIKIGFERYTTAHYQILCNYIYVANDKNLVHFGRYHLAFEKVPAYLKDI